MAALRFSESSSKERERKSLRHCGYYRTPLRYPGGKSRAVSIIRRYIPADIKEIASPFLGGGSVELACAADGIRVYGSDSFEPLVNFWTQLQADSVLLAERVRLYYPLEKSAFYRLQRDFAELSDPIERAAVFFVLNRCSFSGTTLSGGMSPGHPRFTESAIARLRSFYGAGLSVCCADYQDALRRHEDKFLYLDPPYANGGRLYGERGDKHAGFDHEALAALLNRRSGWILSYNDSPYIRDLYAKQQILTPEWLYGMSSNKGSKELLIMSL